MAELTPKNSTIVMPKLQDLKSRDLPTLSIHHPKILHTITSALFFLGLSYHLIHFWQELLFSLFVIQFSSECPSALQAVFFCYQFNLPNLEVLRVLSSCWSLDCWFTRRLSINHVFLASGVRMKKNLKALLIKVIENVGCRVKRVIWNSINKSFNGSYCTKYCWEIKITRRNQAWVLEYHH